MITYLICIYTVVHGVATCTAFVEYFFVVRVYLDVLESDDHSFTGFDLDSGYVLRLYRCFPCSVTLICPSRSVFNNPANKAVVSRLVTEVQTLNPLYQASTIKGK